MSPVYYWRTLEDGALLLIVLGILGAIQIVLSYMGAFVYQIISTIVLAVVPIGVVLVQATATALLAELLGRRLFRQERRPGVPVRGPVKEYLFRFLILLFAMLIVLGIWGGFFALIFFYSPFTQFAFMVGYIIANTAGALIVLTLVSFFEWLFRR